jgi:hypothetical protein
MPGMPAKEEQGLRWECVWGSRRTAAGVHRTTAPETRPAGARRARQEGDIAGRLEPGWPEPRGSSASRNGCAMHAGTEGATRRGIVWFPRVRSTRAVCPGTSPGRDSCDVRVRASRIDSTRGAERGARDRLRGDRWSGREATLPRLCPLLAFAARPIDNLRQLPRRGLPCFGTPGSVQPASRGEDQGARAQVSPLRGRG